MVHSKSRACSGGSVLRVYLGAHSREQEQGGKAGVTGKKKDSERAFY